MERHVHAGATGSTGPPRTRQLDATTVSSNSLDTASVRSGDSPVPSASLDTTTAGPVSSTSLEATTAAREATGGRAIAPGSSIGRYIVLRELGAGAVGVVFEAIDPELDRKVAIKLLQPDSGPVATESADARARLVREAQALARLSHPNVVGIFDVGTHDAHVWLAMELVVGRTLRRWLAERGPDWREVLEVMQAVGRGLAAAHAAGLVHRDIKPDNIMLGDDGRARVMDFGLARRGAPGADESAATPTARAETMLAADVTLVGALLGTPAYMAPEQFRGETADAQADIFAFCVMLWEGLHGERPFAGDTLEGLRANVEAGRILGRPRRARAPRWIDAVLIRGLATVRAQRWATMDDLLAALERGRRGARARRWATAVGALALAGAGAAAYGRHIGAQAEAACVVAGASLDEAWNDEVQAQLRAGLLATGVPYAETTADRVSSHIEAQAAALREARTEACMDTRVRGAWSEELLSRAEWCLDERRMELAALVAELSRADRDSVQRAVQAAASLAQVAACRDRRRLETLPAPPQDRGQAATVRRMLSQAAALREAGKYAESLAVARGALLPAEALGWPPLTATTHQAIGTSLLETGEYAEAEAELETSYFQAAAAFAQEEATEAAATLVFLVGDRRARHDDGLRWSRLADVALALGGVGPEDLRRAEALNNLAVVRAGASEFAEAKALLERALAIRERELGPDHLAVAAVLNDLGIVHFNLKENAAAAALHERALAIRERALGPAHPGLAQSLCNLATVRIVMGDDAAAKALLERALAIDEKALGPEHPKVSLPLGILAELHLNAEDFAAARGFAARALAIDEEALGPDHPDVALALNILAATDRAAGRYDTARARLERALNIRERAFDPDHPAVADSLDNLARVQIDMGAEGKAEPLALRSLAIRERALGPDAPEVARSLELLGEIRVSLGALAEARLTLERLLALQERRHGPDDAGVGETLAGLASIAVEQGRPADAVPLAERALRIGERSAGSDASLAELRFTLARALWAAPADGPRDRARARTLAQAALAVARATDGEAADIAVIESFLRQR